MVESIINLINKVGKQGPKNWLDQKYIDIVIQEMGLTKEEYIGILEKNSVSKKEKDLYRNHYFVKTEEKIYLFKSSEEELRPYIAYVIYKNDGELKGEEVIKYAKKMYTGYTLADKMGQNNLNSYQEVVDQQIRNVINSNITRKENAKLFKKEALEKNKKRYIYSLKEEGVILAKKFEKKLNEQKMIDYIEENNIYNIRENETIGYSKRRKTNKKLAQIKLIEEQNKCEYNYLHTTFPSKYLNNFVEVHHFIPLSAQIYVPEIDLDSIENLVTLCPNCHRQIHLGNKEAKEEIFNEIYNKKEKSLKRIGINEIDVFEIYNLYLK